MAAKPLSPFVFGCSVSVFPDDEIEVLTARGTRLESLATGTASPATAEEKRFLLVHREEAEPRTLAERAWVRLVGRREFESAEQPKPPPPPPDNHGMVEFDADRCWW